MLHQYVDSARDLYDHILIGFQLNLNILAIITLVAADSVLIPAQPQFFPAKEPEMLFPAYSQVRRKMNLPSKICPAEYNSLSSTIQMTNSNFTQDT